MMSDITSRLRSPGRGPLGGNPGGVVSGETFAGGKRMVEDNPNSIIISAHHYVLKNTTVGFWPMGGLVRDDTGGWRMAITATFSRAIRRAPRISVGSTAKRIQKYLERHSIPHLAA